MHRRCYRVPIPSLFPTRIISTVDHCIPDGGGIQGPGRLKTADVLRGILILGVVFVHIETVADELLAICGEIDAWKEKKGSEEANAKYNEVLRYGFEDDRSRFRRMHST